MIWSVFWALVYSVLYLDIFLDNPQQFKREYIVISQLSFYIFCLG